MKILAIVILLFISTITFGQTVLGEKSGNKPRYSEDSEITVLYNDSTNNYPPQSKPAGLFVNGTFIGSQFVFKTINSEKIESLKVEKENFEKNGIEYYGKLLIEMKSGYNPNFISLKQLTEKYLKLNPNPVIFQIDENVLNQDYSDYLIDENFVLKIMVSNIRTSEKNIEINLIRIITKTSENIKKANEISIKGTEL